MKSNFGKLEGNYGLVLAHTDDDLIHSQFLKEAKESEARLHKIALSLGRKSTLNNYRDWAPNFVSGGGRLIEGIAFAGFIGMSSEHLDYPDGQIGDETEELIPIVREWALRRHLGTIVTLGGLIDHDDHIASAKIAREAVAGLRVDGKPINILEVQQYGEGDFNGEVTEESLRIAYRGAELHGSQFQTTRDPGLGWKEVSDGLYMHPDSVAGLSQYPIDRRAGYELSQVY